MQIIFTLVLILAFPLQGKALLASLHHRRKKCSAPGKASVLKTETGLLNVDADEAREVKKLAFLEVLRKQGGEPKDPEVDAAMIHLSPLSRAKGYSEAELESALQGEWRRR
jgi:hypothetical protein